MAKAPTKFWKVGEHQIIILKAIRDHPDKAYGSGLFMFAEGLNMEQIYLVILRLKRRGLIRATKEIHKNRQFFGAKRMLYAITEEGMAALKRAEEK